MSGVLINPIQTTNASGTFFINSDGLMQGTMQMQPNSRYNLRQGTIGGTTPLYGGYAVQVAIPSATNSGVGNYAGTLTPSTSVATINGLTVFDQSVGLISSPQSTVPVGAAGQSISYVIPGAQSEIVVACSPALVSLDTGLINQQVSWDFTNQQLIPYVAAYAAATPTAYSYTSSTGILQLTFSPAPGPIANDVVTLTGFTGANTVFNGAFTVVSTASAGTILNLQATAGLGSLTPTLGTLVAGGGAFPCQILSISSGNSFTVTSTAAATGNYYNWNQSGTAAVILF